MNRVVHIIDIDTTIANNDHRAELLQKHCVTCGSAKTHGIRSFCNTCQTQTDDKITQESWDTFLDPDLMALDTPVPEAQEAISQMRKHNMEFHFLTGRNESFREVTTEWLRRYFGFDEKRESLKMRPMTMMETSSTIYKEHALKELIEERNLQDASFFFYEDDIWVFRMYAKYGIVLQCPEAWKSFCPAGQAGVGHWQRR